MIGLVLAAAVLRPARWLELLALGLAIVAPPLQALVGFGLLALRRKDENSVPEVAFHQGVAAELRSGAALRSALVSAADRVEESDLSHMQRLCRAGVPLGDVADELEEALPRSGRLAAIAVRVGALSGGSVAAAFSSLAAIESDRIELVAESRAAAAGVRASMYVVGGLPAAAVLLGVVDVSLIGRSVAEITVVGLGGLLLIGGAATMIRLARAS